jgi:hypothetical protein
MKLRARVKKVVDKVVEKVVEPIKETEVVAYNHADVSQLQKEGYIVIRVESEVRGVRAKAWILTRGSK